MSKICKFKYFLLLVVKSSPAGTVFNDMYGPYYCIFTLSTAEFVKLFITVHVLYSVTNLLL